MRVTPGYDNRVCGTGNAILAANPNWLIFVEGTEWGSNLQGVSSKPVRLSKANRVVYAVAQYSADTAPNALISDPTFPANMRPYWNTNFGFIVLSQIAPVMSLPIYLSNYHLIISSLVSL